jgi:hypothetical protein
MWVPACAGCAYARVPRAHEGRDLERFRDSSTTSERGVKGARGGTGVPQKTMGVVSPRGGG